MKHKVSPGYFCIVFIALLLSSVTAEAQSETGTVLGTIRDTNGAIVVGAIQLALKLYF